MTHFDWRIDYLKKYSSCGEHNNIVYEVGYTCTGINTSGIMTTKHSEAGSVLLSTENLVDPISYGSLTEDIVQGWISKTKPTGESIIEGFINGGDDYPIDSMPWN